MTTSDQLAIKHVDFEVKKERGEIEHLFDDFWRIGGSIFTYRQHYRPGSVNSKHVFRFVEKVDATDAPYKK